MRKHLTIFIGIGSISILTGILYLLLNLSDKSVMVALPFIITGASIIAVYLFLFDKTKALKNNKDKF